MSFLIDGGNYELPTLDTFTFDEAAILYNCSGLALEDFAVDEEDPESVALFQKNIRNPGYVRALMTVAYIRGNPGLTEAKASAVIGKSNFVEAIQNFIESLGGGDDGPPELARSANGTPDSGASSASSSVPSGGTSTSDSDEPDATQEVTGTSE